jgi:SAM-dependent methyltransferase
VHPVERGERIRPRARLDEPLAAIVADAGRRDVLDGVEQRAAEARGVGEAESALDRVVGVARDGVARESSETPPANPDPMRRSVDGARALAGCLHRRRRRRVPALLPPGVCASVRLPPQGTTMNPNQALWEKGDFSRIAASMRTSGDALVESLGVKKGMKVLDLACGDGNTAIPEAERGADVLGVDISTKLVAAATRRAQELGLQNLRVRHGDACDLQGLADDSFDLVVSIFGAMFAPKPGEAAKEMVRVTKPGGRVVMGNWIPNDPTLVAQLLKISSAYTPPPPEGFVSPMLWGVESHVRERFAAAGIAADALELKPETFTFDFDGSPEQYVDAFRRYYGPTMNAFEAAEKNGRADALQAELEALFRKENRRGSNTRTVIPATFLRVTAHVR